VWHHCCDVLLTADRRPESEGGIGTAEEREYVRTFFDRSRLKKRHGESMREVCERLQIETQVLGLEEGAAVAAGPGAGIPKL
jgi:hypothetical protein